MPILPAEFEVGGNKSDEAPAFCTSVGCPGISLYAFALVLSMAHMYIAFVYTYNFRYFKREWVFAFFLLAGLFFLLVIYHILSWRGIASKTKTKSKKTTPEKVAQKRIRPISCISKARLLKSYFDINGKWFLFKLYISEFFESCVQMYNLWNFYTCALSPGFVCGLCAFLTLDHAFRLYAFLHPFTATSRDAQVVVDLGVDLSCMVLPLTILYFEFRIPISVLEMLSVVLWPTLSTIVKLDDIMEENVVRQTSMRLISLQTATSIRISRRRSSLYQKTELETVLEAQQKAVGKHIKQGLALCTAASMVFFFVFGVAVVAVPTQCDVLWGKGCSVKVPMCRLQLSCDCAVLHIDGHNMTYLPESLNTMKSLRSMTVTRGPLDYLPSLSGFEHLAILNASENYLTSLPSLPLRLQKLMVDKNRISSLLGLKDAPNVYEIHASYNNISIFPPVGPRTYDVRLTNNSLVEIGNTENVLYLAVGGNQIKKVSKDSEVQYLNIPNNQLVDFPKWNSLVQLDVRGNALASMPDLAVQDIWVHGNPLCSNGWTPPSSMKAAMDKPGQGCAKQCSRTCLDVYVGDGVCFLECISCSGEEGDC